MVKYILSNVVLSIEFQRISNTIDLERTTNDFAELKVGKIKRT